MYDNSVFASAATAKAASKEVRSADPAYVLAESVVNKMMTYSPEIQKLRPLYNEGHRLYIAGLMRMQPDKAWASDANFTIRLTYGNILPYNPADAIPYNYFTTLEGVIAKED